MKLMSILLYIPLLSSHVGDWIKANWKWELLGFVCLLIVVVGLRSSLRKRR